jgi:hypothetical protein
MVNKFTSPAYNHAGGVFMCRQYHLYGWMAVAFGAGILAGSAIDSGFWALVVGVGAIVAGLCRVVKK